MLEELKQIRKFYILSLFFPFLKDKYDTYAGICYHLYDRPYQYGEEIFEELIITYGKYKSYVYGGYMYKKGRIWPRLVLIQKTIKRLS